MAKIAPVYDGNGDFYAWYFECPGCGSSHLVPTVHTKAYHTGPLWEFNGDVNKPSFKPSVRSRTEYGEPRQQHCCHFVMTDGVLNFCDDCTHAMASQSVLMADAEITRVN